MRELLYPEDLRVGVSREEVMELVIVGFGITVAFCLLGIYEELRRLNRNVQAYGELWARDSGASVREFNRRVG